MPKCSFCGVEYGVPKGVTLVMIDGTVKHLCSSKCLKKMKMKPRKTKWVIKEKKVKEKKTKVEKSEEKKK